MCVVWRCILCICIIGFLNFNAILIKFCENDGINVMRDVHYVIYVVYVIWAEPSFVNLARNVR